MTLEQTKGSFKLRGEIVGLSNPDNITEGTIKNGKYEGKNYKIINFGVKTRDRDNDKNIIYLNVFGIEDRDLKGYDTNNNEVIDVSWEERFNLPKGCLVLGIQTSFIPENGKVKKKNLSEHDAIEAMQKYLEDGETVFVSGRLEGNSFENQSGEQVSTVRYQPQRISKNKESIDYEKISNGEKEEISDFEIEMVFQEAVHNKEGQRVNVYGYLIDYNGNPHTIQFYIDEAKYPKMAKAFLKKLKFGDLIKVAGKIHNTIETVEQEDEEEDEWGGELPESYRNTLKNVVRELEITAIVTMELESGEKVKKIKKYKEEDFESAVEEEEIDENPFDIDDDDDELEDDIPF